MASPEVGAVVAVAAAVAPGRARRLGVVLALALAAAACQGEGEVTTTAGSNPTNQVETAPSTSPDTTTTATLGSVDPVDLIFTGGPVVTMEPSLGTVEAIAIDGDVIVAVGSAVEIARYEGSETRVIDLEGRAVIPGIVDAHTHILSDMGGVAAGQALALANGITTVGDASVEPGLPEVFSEAAESGELRVRTNLYLTRNDPCGVDQGLWYEAYPADAILGERLRVAGVKIFSDGGVCGILGASEVFLEGFEVADPYHDLDTLTSYISAASDLGYQVLIHAQGDLAVANSQKAFESILDGAPNVMRHRIDHNAIVTEDIASRYNDLGLVVVLFGSSEACRADLPWTDFYKDNAEEPGEIVAANPDVVFAWHGDDPWLSPISPMAELFSLVTRGRVDDDGSVCEPPDWMAGEGVTVEQGLAMMTTGSAYALRQEDVVGSLTPGKFADLVVLTHNPLTIPPGELPDIGYLMTMIGGAVEFCAAGAEMWCPGWTAPQGPSATSSASRSDHRPELVFDGVAEGESFWSSGAEPPQWIQVDFPVAATLSAIRFVVFQNPASDTVHELEVLVDGEWTLATAFTGFTTTGDVLTWRASPGIENAEAFRMTTLESLSWPEWYEIEYETGS